MYEYVGPLMVTYLFVVWVFKSILCSATAYIVEGLPTPLKIRSRSPLFWTQFSTWKIGKLPSVPVYKNCALCSLYMKFIKFVSIS